MNLLLFKQLFKSIITHYYPLIFIKYQSFDNLGQEKQKSEHQNKSLRTKVKELETFIANMKIRLDEESEQVKKRKVITCKEGKNFWLEVHSDYERLHILVFDLRKGKNSIVGDIYPTFNTRSSNTVPHLFVIDIGVNHPYQNKGIGQIIFQETVEWINKNESNIQEIRGNLSDVDVGKPFIKIIFCRFVVFGQLVVSWKQCYHT